jgi:peptide deformylase
MAVRSILRAGNPLLRKRSQEFTEAEIRSPETAALIADMFDTMEKAHGQGLAAPQIGVLKRLVIVRLFREEGSGRDRQESFIDRVLFNPQIEILEGSKLGSWEGCLSVPGMAGYVERKRRIRLTFLDETARKHEELVEGYDAVVYQHECDHLDGVLYVDRLADPRLFGFDEDLDAKALKAIVAGR